MRHQHPYQQYFCIVLIFLKQHLIVLPILKELSNTRKKLKEHGIEPGARVAVYPPGTSNLAAPGVSGIEAVVTSATPTSSVALAAGEATVLDGSRARLVSPGPTVAPIAVRVCEGCPPVTDSPFFVPVDASQKRDDAKGIRQLTVGTGEIGRAHV